MTFEEMQSQFLQKILDKKLIHATISQPRQKSNECKRVKLKPIELKGTYYIQIEYQYERILKHENISLDNFEVSFELLLEQYRQIHAQFNDETVQIQLSKKNKVLYKSEPLKEIRDINLSHNRKKQYLLDESVVHPFLVRLGVQSENGQIKKQKYDKFKQINRFIEFVDDCLPHLPTDKKLKIIDFGSGKSYLTFALYYYLYEIKNLDIQIIGLDLKKEVIEHCNTIANDLNYSNLKFLVGDIGEYNEETAVDMVVTLHACDVATDMALAKAVKWGAKVILSVPCCQHELNRQLQNNPLEIMLKHGIIKERFAALATDSIRAEILNLVGYDTQLLEFISIDNTPKNILIRAFYNGKKPTQEQINNYEEFIKFLNATPFLHNELKDFLEPSL